ncbi:MAG: Calx-beta domain-containing protein, partial [Verrucomicrobiales bacterium]
YGSLTLNANGTYSYAIDNSNATVQALAVGQTLTDSFNYTLSDGSLTDTAVLAITIQGRNDAPVGVNDTGTAVEAGGTANGTPGSNASGNVLTNDTDVDTAAASLTVTAVRTGATEGAGTAGTLGSALAGTYGSLTLNANGTYSYAIDNSNATVQALAVGQTLTDSFNYTLSDGSLTDTAVLVITIQGRNDAPSIDFDVDDSEGTGGADFAATFTEGTPPVSISDTLDTQITDVDDTAMSSMTWTLAAILDGDLEILSINGTDFPLGTTTGSPVSVIAGATTFAITYNSATGVFAFANNSAGDMPVNDLRTLIASTTYRNESLLPSLGNRILSATVNDGDAVSNTATTTLSVVRDAESTAWSISGSSSVIEGSSATYTISLSNAIRAGETASVAIGLTDLDTTGADHDTLNTALVLAVSDYNASPAPGTLAWDGTTLTFTSDGSGVMTPLSVSLGTTDDTTFEGDEDFKIVLSTPGSTTGETVSLNTSSVTTTITDDADRPSLSIANIAVTEGTDTHAVFSLVLSNPSVEPVVLSLALADGSALIGTDTGSTLEYFDGSAWQPVAGDVTIPAGQTTLLVRTTVTDDALDENPETFTLTAVHVSGTLLSSADVTATGMITDDDPAPGLSINDVAVNEAAGSATFTVTLDAPSGLTVTVDYATASGSATSGADFTATSGSLTFAPGETSKTVTVAITNDGTYEGLETFTVDLSNAANASFLDASGTGTITDDGTGPGGSDDDRPSLSIANIAVTEGTDTHAVFSLVLSNPSVEPVVLSLALADGSALIGTDTGSTLEYFDGSAWQPVAGDVTIPAGQTTLLVRTTVTDDALDENPETFTLTAVHVSGTLLSSADVTATGMITDDDPAPGLSINDVAVNEAAGSATFTVTLDAPSGLTVTVDYATASGSATSGADFTAASGSLTFAPGETSKTITVAITNDGTYEGLETFTVDLSNAANASFLDASGTGSITDDGTGPGGPDDDRPSLSIANIAVTEGTDTHAVFSLVLSNPSVEPVVLSLVLADGSALIGTDTGSTLEYFDGSAWQPVPGDVTIPAGQTTLLVRTTVTDDALDENPETFTLTAVHVSGTLLSSADVTATGTITDDDPAPELSINDVAVNEAAGSATFTVTLDAPSGLTVTVDYATASGSATSGADFTATSGSLTFAPGETSKTVTVAITNDGTYEGLETFTVDLSNAANASFLDASGSGSITDDGTGPGGSDDDRPSLSIANIAVTEGTDTHAVFSLVLSNPSVEPVVLSLALADGSALIGTDTGSTLEYFDGSAWQPVPGDVTIPAGQTTLLVRTTVTDDALDENPETFTLTAVHVSGTLLSSADVTATGMITDDDPAPGLSINDVAVNEAAGSATFTVTLDAPSGLTVTVDYATASGSATSGADFTATSGSLTFAPGETSKTVTVAITNDGTYEGLETFTVDLSNAANATFLDASGTGTITDDGTGPGGSDDDRPSLSIANIAVTEGTDTHAVFSLVLSNPSVEPVVLSLALADGSALIGTDTGSDLEYFDGSAWQAVAGTVTIPAGQTTLLVRTTVTDDALDENPETFTLTAVHVSGTLLSSADVTATATITDDDPAPGLSINDVAVNEAAGSATFTVTLDAPSGLTVTVDYATASGSATSGADFTATSGSLTFAPGETSKTVTVSITNDGTYEGLETFTVDLSNAANATFLDASGTGSITDDGTGPGGSDDDRPSLSIANLAVTEGTDTHAVFSLVLSNPSVEPVVLSLALADGSALIGTDTGSDLEYFDGSAWQAVAGTVTIPAGQTTLLVRTTVTDDALDENPETFTLTAVHVSGTLLSSADVTATGTITDDDPAPGLSINDVAVNEAAGSATFTVTLDAASGLTVTVDYATASGSATSGADFTATSGSLTFAPGETSKTVTVAITNDGTFELNETFTVDLSNAANGSFLDASGSGTIIDDDVDAVDDPYTTDEDTSITGNVLTNDHNTNGGLSVIEIGGNLSDIGKLVPGDNGGTFLIGTDGSYTFHPGPDFQYLVNGESVVTSVTYTAVNPDGNTDTATLSITVTGVNDRPIIDLNSQVDLQYTAETAFLAASGVTSVESFETAVGTL